MRALWIATTFCLASTSVFAQSANKTIMNLDTCFKLVRVTEANCSAPENDAAQRQECLQNARKVQIECLELAATQAPAPVDRPPAAADAASPEKPAEVAAPVAAADAASPEKPADVAAPVAAIGAASPEKSGRGRRTDRGHRHDPVARREPVASKRLQRQIRSLVLQHARSKASRPAHRRRLLQINLPQRYRRAKATASTPAPTVAQGNWTVSEMFFAG